MPDSWPYQNAELPTAERVNDLLARMTLTEKIGQLHQGFDLNADHHTDIREGKIGSAIVANSATSGNDRQARVRAAQLNALQRVAVQESRLGIPLLFARDVIHGHRTVAPIPLGQAASFSPELIRACAEIAALEARADGIHWVFTPMLDVARDARWGRVAEGFGEDAFLASTLAYAAVRGYQGEEKNLRVAACAKHFVGYGTVEGGRDYNTLEVSAYTLQNVHLMPFRAAVKAGVATVMSAFCDWNGLPVAAHSYLLNDILRGQLGFQGVLVTDWEGALELMRHGVAGSVKEAAALAFEAGNDMDMVSGIYRQGLPEALATGQVSLEALDEAVQRVLTLKFQLGLFEQPYTDEMEAERVQFRPAARETVRELARRSIVLLKNAGDVLPLQDVNRVGVFGPAALWREQLFGTWTLDGQEGDVPTLLESLRGALPGVDVWHTLNLDEALDWARHTDVVIVPVGETPTRSGEDHSIASLELPAGQQAWLEALHEVGVKVVTVVLTGRPLVLSRVLKFSEAVVLAWHPGVTGGEAIAEVLCGRVNPSGKLPMSLPRHTGQVPLHYAHHPTGRPVEVIPGAYRLSDMLDGPLLPFGFGLSYTEFRCSALRVSADYVPMGESVTVSATVVNVGAVAGETVVQLYLRDVVSSRVRPVRELCGFQRVALHPGEAREVQFSVGKAELGFYDELGTFRLEEGEFRFWLGLDSRADLETGFWLTSERN